MQKFFNQFGKILEDRAKDSNSADVVWTERWTDKSNSRVALETEIHELIHLIICLTTVCIKVAGSRTYLVADHYSGVCDKVIN